MKQQIVISLCDRTGIMLKPWAEVGYRCYAVDIQHKIRKDKVEKVGMGEIIYTWGDARSWKYPENERPVFIAAFPVCTNLSVSGSQDFIKKGIPMLFDGLMLFNACEQIASWSGAPYCIENPVGVIPHHHRRPDYYFHPWFYGDTYTKKTCLWCGNGFIMPDAEFITKPASTSNTKILFASPGPNRQNIRSETPQGFAEAVFKVNYPLVAAKHYGR